MEDNINLGIGFDSKSVDESTRGLKKQMRVVGAMMLQFEEMKKQLEANEKAEKRASDTLDEMTGASLGFFKSILPNLSNLRASLEKTMPGFSFIFNILDNLKSLVGGTLKKAFDTFLLPFKWIITKGIKAIQWATDFGARISEIADSAVNLEHRFTRFSNLFGSEKFAGKINKWQYDMLQTMPLIREDLDDFTVQMRELGMDPRNGNLKGVIGAALGPGNSFSGVMSALMGAAGESNDVMGLFTSLGRTLSPEKIMNSLRGATTQQERFSNLLELMNKTYGTNVDRSQRLISTSLSQIDSFWSEFKEDLVGAPQEGNLLWYIQQVFVDIKGWIAKNKTVLFSFANSISHVLGGVGKVIYSLFTGMTSYGAKAIGGIQNAAEQFKGWALRAEGQLGLWAIKIKDVFKDASKQGLGFWATMGKLWTDAFGGKTGMVSKFWQGFKDIGSDVISWLGKKLSDIFGYEFQKGVLSLITKEDGSFRWGTAGIGEFFSAKTAAYEKFHSLENITSADIAGAKSRLLNPSMRRKIIEDSRNVSVGEYKKSYYDLSDADNTQSNRDLLASMGYVVQRRVIGGLQYSKLGLTDKKEARIQNELDKFLSTSSPSFKAGNSKDVEDLSSAGNERLRATAAGLGMNLEQLQINSTYRPGTANHGSRGAFDIQATPELLAKFNIPKELTQVNATKWHPIIDKDGYRLAYESPTEAGGRGHFHVDGGKNPDGSSDDVSTSIRDVFITINTKATEPTEVGKVVVAAVRNIDARGGTLKSTSKT